VARLGPDAIRIELVGDWQLGQPAAAAALPLEQTRRLVVDGSALGKWDSSLLVWLRTLLDRSRQRHILVELENFPEAIPRLLALADAAPKAEPGPGTERPGLFDRVGQQTLGAARATYEFLAFLGDAIFALGRFVSRRARYRLCDVLLHIEDAGLRAVGIVSVISFLVGAILALAGAAALDRFGALAYVADFVGAGVVRELAAIATAIVVAGRSGSAYAAELATMNVTQEMDALRTMGLRPMDFLVLPRMLALSLMVPLLYLYASAVGVAGGALVATSLLHQGLAEYLARTRDIVTLSTIWMGLIKTSVFGVLVAIIGCREGIRAQGSAGAVGEAATRAVTSSTIAVIVADCVFAVIFHILEI
jgi:phospholipid/cholesterol/gamma-HCH transport system permease protein